MNKGKLRFYILNLVVKHTSIPISLGSWLLYSLPFRLSPFQRHSISNNMYLWEEPLIDNDKKEIWFAKDLK